MYYLSICAPLAYCKTCGVGSFLPWGHVSPLSVVHSQGMAVLVPMNPYGFRLFLIMIALCTSQELAFRSAILYGGLLMSNAFGSVRDFLPLLPRSRSRQRCRVLTPLPCFSSTPGAGDAPASIYDVAYGRK